MIWIHVAVGRPSGRVAGSGLERGGSVVEEGGPDAIADIADAVYSISFARRQRDRSSIGAIQASGGSTAHAIASSWLQLARQLLF